MSRSDFIHPEMKPLLVPYIKPGMKVTVVAYSFFDQQYPTRKQYDIDYAPEGKYYVKVIEQLVPFGIKESDIMWIHYFDDDKETAIKKIKAADILFFPGGAPERFMDRIREKGLFQSINHHQKTYIGVSAGTMIQFKNYHISPDGDYHTFMYLQGLDLLEGFYVEVHYRRRKKQKSGMRKVFRAHRKPIYIIPDDGGLIVDQGIIKPMHKARQYYHKRGVIR